MDKYLYNCGKCLKLTDKLYKCKNGVIFDGCKYYKCPFNFENNLDGYGCVCEKCLGIDKCGLEKYLCSPPNFIESVKNMVIEGNPVLYCEECGIHDYKISVYGDGIDGVEYKRFTMKNFDKVKKLCIQCIISLIAKDKIYYNELHTFYRTCHPLDNNSAKYYKVHKCDICNVNGNNMYVYTDDYIVELYKKGRIYFQKIENYENGTYVCSACVQTNKLTPITPSFIIETLKSGKYNSVFGQTCDVLGCTSKCYAYATENDLLGFGWLKGNKKLSVNGDINYISKYCKKYICDFCVQKLILSGKLCLVIK